MADKLFPIMSVPTVGRFAPPFVPWEFMAPHEAQARQNHQQSLARLAERGGLDVTEALAVIEGRHWQALPIQQAGTRFCAALKQWEETNGELGRLRARVAELEQAHAEQVAEREHLEEGARLCMLAWPLLDAPIFEDEREAFALFFDAERARQAKGDKP